MLLHIDEEIALNRLYTRKRNFELLACEAFWKQYLHILNQCYKAFVVEFLQHRNISALFIVYNGGENPLLEQLYQFISQ